MPNYCSNSLTITTSDKQFIQDAITAFNKDGLLEFLVPIGEWDYDTAVANWGTKWEVSGDGAEPIIQEDSVTFYFESAWCPPIEAYDTLVERGFGVEAYYFEPGVAFYGIYENGEDNCYDFDSFEELPEEIIEVFGLEECDFCEEE